MKCNNDKYQGLSLGTEYQDTGWGLIRASLQEKTCLPWQTQADYKQAVCPSCENDQQHARSSHGDKAKTQGKHYSSMFSIHEIPSRYSAEFWGPSAIERH